MRNDEDLKGRMGEGFDPKAFKEVEFAGKLSHLKKYEEKGKEKPKADTQVLSWCNLMLGVIHQCNKIIG